MRGCARCGSSSSDESFSCSCSSEESSRETRKESKISSLTSNDLPHWRESERLTSDRIPTSTRRDWRDHELTRGEITYTTRKDMSIRAEVPYREVPYREAERDYCRYPCPPCPSRNDPGIAYFTSVIVPTSNLVAQYTSSTGSVEFLMRRKNKTVVLQWESFSGIVGASGIAFLTATQSFSNLPPYSIFSPYVFQHRGGIRVGYVEVEPNGRGGNIKFYLNSDGSSSDVNMGDAFVIYANSVTWIVE